MTQNDSFAADDAGVATLTETVREPVGYLPRWKLLLHNDDVNDMDYVADTIRSLTILSREEAVLRMNEAHKSGVALILSTHREHAELLEEQFRSKRLVVTIEPE